MNTELEKLEARIMLKIIGAAAALLAAGVAAGVGLAKLFWH